MLYALSLIAAVGVPWWLVRREFAPKIAALDALIAERDREIEAAKAELARRGIPTQ